MSSQKFRFVSPGIFMNEVDKSQLDKTPAPVGPVVIGRSERGPGLRPVTVNSFLEFAELFGNPVPGGESEDVWRNGNKTSPMYATYAARAWLKNGSPLTFVRVVGASSDDPTAEGTAGWTTTASPSTTAASNGGAFALYVAPHVPSGTAPINGTLSAVFYLNEGMSLRLTGAGQDGGALTGGACELVKSSGDNYQFTAILSSSAGETSIPFDFNEKSENYIRKAFNTNPTLLGADNPSDTKYFLGESFDESLKNAHPDAGDAGSAMAFVVALKDNQSRQKDAQRATSGYVISQCTGLTSSLPTDATDLFRFESIDLGSWINHNVKVSIRDVASSTSPDYDPYGTFTVEIRDASDTDENPKVLETFTNCNLNPESANYICAKVGDKYATWDKAAKKFTEYGDYSNKSKYVYIKPSSKLTSGEIDPSLLPFGFRGPQTWATVTGNLGTDPGGLWVCEFPRTSSESGIGGAAGANNALTMSGPQMPLRVSSSSPVRFSDPTDVYWGATTSKSASSLFAASYCDLTRMLPDQADGVATADTFVFSLDNIAYVSSSTRVESQAFYADGNRAASLASGNKAISAGGYLPGTGGTQASASYQSVLDAGFNRFTMPMVGGFDGFDILHRDPLSNKLMDTKNEDSSYAYNSIKRAMDTVADSEVVEMNAAAIPGITVSSLTSHLISVCENRADSLAILDLEGGYVPAYENASGEATIGGVDTTVSSLQDRSINSSYACAYYPWVQTKDETGSGKILWVPPSVAALGTFASNDKKSAPWFAPAGFTRGGLSDGAAGIPVIGVREHLTRKMRDKLYENNVNPIAKFPAEGIVIFGQKTMQATPSALDRVNVRRMMIHVKKGISNIASTLLFDQNVQTTWARFLGKAEPFLRDVQAQLGLTDYKIVLDETTTTPDLVDRNIMYAKIFLQPARSIEYIAIDFVIQRTGASFDD